ncbi:hypothetical protein K4L44_01805 [Halosquirtibacter laminarini]|uniref:Uncharacterized protein n=1 Tax=Halosquirtibacter laminarini TaxID=3374600 RepID=A0AC61NNT2_9BACT|nr:hypothetical protein K4L44_01805 [Prolixibacteraceae bacterium]
MYRLVLRSLFLVFCVLASNLVFGQNNTSSPYSMYGVGQTGINVNAKSAAMGGVSLGIRSNERINPTVAASYTALDSIRVYYDLGLMGTLTFASDYKDSETTFDANLTSFNLATRVLNRWYVGLGLFSKSSVGYNITTYNTVEGTLQEYPTYWSGTGGLSQFYFNNGFKITDNFSLGVNISAYVGPMTSKKQQVLETSNSVEVTTDELSENYSGLTGNISAQYTLPIGSSDKVVFGGRFTPSSTLSGDTHQEVIQSSSNSSIIDTIKYETTDASVIDLPSMYAVGASYMMSDKMVVAFDYQHVNWGNITSNNADYNYVNQNLFNVGFEYVNNKQSLKYKDHIAYRLGFKYDDGYLDVRHERLTDRAITLGLGLPIRKSLSYIDVAFQFGQKGSNAKGMIQENYGQCIITFSLSDRWFKRRIID